MASSCVSTLGRLLGVGLAISLIGVGWPPMAQDSVPPAPPTNLRIVTGGTCERGCGLGAVCTGGSCVCPAGTTGDPDVVCESPACPTQCDIVAGCTGGGSCLPCPSDYQMDDGICTPRYEMHLRQFYLSNGRYLRYYGNRSLDLGSEGVVRAVIVIHGTNRDADLYYRYLWETAEKEDAQRRTLIVAPWFRIAADGPAEGEVAWQDNSDWKDGDQSAPTPTISSYRALDEILAVLHARLRFPNLRQVIVTGHSAGGQYVQRFSLARPLEGPWNMLPLLYAPANAGSYAYLDGERLLSGGSFGIPAVCGSYNEWKYGLEDPNPYVAATPPEDLRAAYRARRVVYLLGQEDDDPADPDLDLSCAAMLQGAHRLERGLRFQQHLEHHFGAPTHEVIVLPGVGHNYYDVYRSSAVRDLFFGD